ncbi:MAG: hypothetical protein FJ098_09305, partial [Deltaproteobacteria bacterium]|nr:hypothetical protein [Deltaproteobacteria bacterium]
MTRAETTLAFLAVLAAACGPATPKLTIRADFTSAEAITTFGMRERILAGQAPGRVTVSTLDGVDFPTVQAAIDRAPPGSVVTIPEGRYEEHLVLEDKVLRLEGAGAARTAVIAAQTALWVSGGEVEVRGLTLVSRSVAESTAVTAFTDTRSRLTDCRVLGGTGPGVLVGGTSTVYLEGNTVTGNMGGGVLVTGGAVTSFRNTLVRNAVAGWVFSPTSHTAIGSVLLDHDTVLDNWSGPRCLSMARRGLIPPEVLAERIRLRGSILNAGGVDECLGPAAAEALRRGALSFFSDGPLPAAGFFRSQDPWDLTPSREIAQKDRDGLELGATPSPEAAERLAAQAQRSLLEGKPWRAYLLSRFLHEEERLRLEAAVQKAIYDQTGSVLGQERVGIFLHNVLALAERVPPSWRLDVLAARLAQAFAAAHRTRVESFELFAAAPPAFRQALEARLAAGLSALPAVLTDQETGARKLMLSGALQGGPRQRLEVAPFQVAETVQNTGIPRLSEKIAFLRGRTDSRGKKIRELDATVSNPHLFPPGKDEKRKEILQDQLAKLREEQAGEEATLAALVAERDAAPPTFEVRLSGAVSRRIVEGEVRLSLIT